MSTLVFVLVFILLGLGVLFVAMSGGPGGIGSVLHSQKRGSRRFATFAFVVSLLVLGVGVPAAVIAATKHDNEINATGVKLTDNEEHGRQLFGERCALCHSLKAANAVAQVGPNLDDLQPNKALVLSTIKSGRSNGNGQMPANIYTGQDAEDVAEFVAKAVGATTPSGG